MIYINIMNLLYSDVIRETFYLMYVYWSVFDVLLNLVVFHPLAFFLLHMSYPTFDILQ